VNGVSWTAPELHAIKDIPLYEHVGYKAIPALRNRTKSAIARKRNQLRKGDLNDHQTD
jgi:hypothetical protein